ncbi:hypothetical protein RN001_015745 [Aquatica leii]|uniref:Uncharacterized protein n=1 Tax=Aquatica leii TaxID=1421715 RepID=A0AAN7S5T5_9COLE|nr:hypothetical protein RN001_015745 [Aquatica leii]
MCSQIIFAIVFFGGLQMILCQESAQYLQNVIWNLENKISEDQTRRRIDTSQLKTSDVKIQKNGSQKVPMLSLTKGELAALYESAVENHQYLKPDTPNSPYVNTVVHEIEDDSSKYLSKPQLDHSAAESDGYYYYYYPLNSFMDNSHNHVQPDSHHHHIEPHIETDKHNPYYHAHTHQHNVHITTTKSIIDHDKKKAMEPLFMAMSSFIGMAVMFVLSILFLPKFGNFKSRGVKQESSTELTNIVQIIFKAIEGDDCSERVLCEIGKAAKAFRVHDNRFLKLFRRISPKRIGWYVDRIEKYSNKNFKCATIQCRRKNIAKSKRPNAK